MVFEATADLSSSSDDSDVNPNPLQATYKLDFSTLPRPNLIGALFVGRDEARLRRAIATGVSAAAQYLHRMPTQDEFNAIAYHTAKGHAMASYGVSVGVFSGACQSYVTRESYKFPFVKPSEGFNSQAVVLGGRTWFTGDQARVVWHALRLTAYGACGGLFARICFGAYAASVMAVGKVRDPRLDALRDAVRKDAIDLRGSLLGRGPAQGKKGDITGQGDTSAGELWRRHRTSIGANKTPADDDSPSQGPQEAEFAQSMAVEEKLYGDTPEPGEMAGAGGGQAIAVATAPLTRQTAWKRAARRARTNPTHTEPDPAGGFYENDDDNASARAMDATSTTSTNLVGGGSAWDRIRRQAGATEPHSRPRRGEYASQMMSPSDDTAAADDRERAQREFDAQLERERQGGSFAGNAKEREW